MQEPENLLFERSEFKFSSVFADFFGDAKSQRLSGLRAISAYGLKSCSIERIST